MLGSVSTYLPEKGYGFIKGDDGKDYFFHNRAFIDKRQISFIAEEARVTFDQEATPRGYRAAKCRLLSESEDILYTVPDTFLVSRNSAIKGWETIESGAWVALGSGSSPDEAKDAMINVASQYGANALLNIRYSKSTGEEPSENGRGTHYFTIHHYEGTIGMVGKRNVHGKYKREDLQGINIRLEEIYNEWVKDGENSKEQRRNGLIVGLPLTLVMLLAEAFIIAVITAALTLAWIMLWGHKPLNFKPLERNTVAHEER